MPNVNSYYGDRTVPCKYYRKEQATQIKCLGLCGTHTCNVFQSKADKSEYKKEFCKGFYWNCPLYIALEIYNGETE